MSADTGTAKRFSTGSPQHLPLTQRMWRTVVRDPHATVDSERHYPPPILLLQQAELASARPERELAPGWEGLSERLSDRIRESFDASQPRFLLGLFAQRLSEVTARLTDMETRYAAVCRTLEEVVEADLGVEELGEAWAPPTPPVDFERISPLLRSTAEELGWDSEFAFVPDRSTVVVTFPAEQSDHIAETTLDFFTGLAEAMDPNDFRQVGFDFEPS